MAESELKERKKEDETEHSKVDNNVDDNKVHLKRQVCSA